MKKRLCAAAVCLAVFGLLIHHAAIATAAEAKAAPVPQFKEVPFPVSDADKRAILASEAVTVDGQTHAIGFNPILRSGDKVGQGIFGLLLDEKGQPVMNKDGSKHISVDNDFSSLIPLGNKLFMVSHFESRPGAMYLTRLEQNPQTGQLRAADTRNIDFSHVGGLWVPCAGSVTPWNTHLGSEEYPNNARLTEAATSMDEIEDYDKPMARYFGVDPYSPKTNVDQFRKVFKPYRYGFPVEVRVSGDGEAEVAKHYAMGRVAVELAYVMPDARTVYISDDGTNVGFFMFVADREQDLSSGTLYAAQWHQVHAGSGGNADLKWVNLGHADNATIREAIEGGTTFSDIFEAQAPAEDGRCADGFASVNTTDGHECLKLKPGMRAVASRLETRRYAAFMGATTEFRKEEGITFDPDNKVLYVAMSEVANGMAPASKDDKGGPDQVRLPVNKCGAVYGLDIRPDAIVGSDYVAVNMYGVVNGIMRDYPKDGDYANNTCDINGIANPDNVTFMRGRDTLVIGEDTGSGHQNDVIWAYNVKTQALTRIQTTPYGAETTSPYFYPNIAGWGYLMSVIQHPYGESDEDKLSDPADAMAYTGYVGPFPAMD